MSEPKSAFTALREAVSKPPEPESPTLCDECSVEQTPEQLKKFGYRKICLSCIEKEEREAKERQEEHRLIRSKSIVPSAYYEIDGTKLTKPNLLNQTLQWQYGPRGLLLHGTTGTGKTRCAWQVVKREVLKGRSVEILDSTAGIRYASKFSQASEQVERWMEEICVSPLVFMDDIFKVKLTDSFESFIFTIVDQRIANELPIIVTSNDTGDSLSKRMTGDRAEPLLRRLRESCHAIAF